MIGWDLNMAKFGQTTSCILARRWKVVCLVVGVLLWTGCAATPPPEEEASLAVFYPPLPNPPRIQYLTTFSSAKDVAESHNAFAKFVMGKDPEEGIIVQKPYGVAIFEGKIFVADTRGPGCLVTRLLSRDI